MKILHISTSDRGGAGIAAVRLHELLLDNGIDSKLLTLYKHETQIREHFVLKKKTFISKLPIVGTLINKVFQKLGFNNQHSATFSQRHLEGRPKGFEYFSFPISDFHLERHPLVKEADIIHLHWVSEGFLDFASFFSNYQNKIVWTLHDMNPFSGGCHHADSCLGYQSTCSNCPQLKGTLDENLAEKMLTLKLEAIKNINPKNLQLITPSAWLGKCSMQSKLFTNFPHHVIANVTRDSSFFRLNKQKCRQELNLPLDKTIVLFVAHNIDNPRKGIHYLLDAFTKLQSQNCILCSVGYKSDELNKNDSIIQLGYVLDAAKMNQIYNAADVFILPSMAENFPNTIIESFYCGTPAIAFSVGGIPEQIDSSNGLIVERLTAQDLALGLDSVITNISKFDATKISIDAKNKFDQSKILNQHVNVYKKLLHA